METIEISQSEIRSKNQNQNKKPSRWRKFLQYLRDHKKIKWTLIVLLVLIIIGIAWAIVWHNNNKKSKKSIAPNVPTTDISGIKAEPKTVADPLTGLQVSKEAASQPVVGIMIENLYPNARPQSGLSSAGAVYEAFAEGGITRFMAVFQEPLPDSIGPVRSLRPYFLRWGLEYDIPIAHAGGSQPALADIKTLGMKNIEALAYGSIYFFRASDRPSPHNLYTNNAKLSALISKLGYDKAPTFTPLPRKEDAAPATAANPNINISYDNAKYNVEWKYDTSNNDYDRYQGSTAQQDRNGSKQLTAKNIVVMYTPTSYGTQPDGKPETNINLIGTGKALVFLDGGVKVATWSKTSNSAQTTFADEAGTAIQFNAGSTWYEVLPVGNSVTY